MNTIELKFDPRQKNCDFTYIYKCEIGNLTFRIIEIEYPFRNGIRVNETRFEVYISMLLGKELFRRGDGPEIFFKLENAIEYCNTVYNDIKNS